MEESVKEEFNVLPLPDSLFMTVKVQGRIHCLCPVTKVPDTLWFKIDFRSNVDGEQIEDCSFREWLETLVSRELGVEGTCHLLYTTILRICKPMMLTVTVSTGYSLFNREVMLTNLMQHLDKK